MTFFIPGINNISTLLGVANAMSTGISQETRDFMRQQGLIVGDLDPTESLIAITGDALGETRTYLNDVSTQFNLPEYRPNSFVMPASYSETISNAMTSLRDLQNVMAANPGFEGTPTAATLREQRQLELMEEQNVINQQLSERIGSLAANTDGLTDILDNLVANSNSSNNLMTSMSETLGNIQAWLFRMEQQIANQNAAAEAAAVAAQAAADAAALAAETAANNTAPAAPAV